jgi:hypothetical protein
MRYVSLLNHGSTADDQDDILLTFGLNPDSLVRSSLCLLIQIELI